MLVTTILIRLALLLLRTLVVVLRNLLAPRAFYTETPDITNSMCVVGYFGVLQDAAIFKEHIDGGFGGVTIRVASNFHARYIMGNWVLCNRWDPMSG